MMWKKLSTLGLPRARARDTPITTAILEEKARQFAAGLISQTFKLLQGGYVGGR